MTTATVSASAAPIAILGVPFDNVTTAETVRLIEQMVASRSPHYLATANIDFLVQALYDVELRRILFEAHLVICDGTPLIWASRLLGNPLPERVAGSDLVPLLIEVAAQKGYRVFFLGGTEETTEAAVQRLRTRYPTLQIAGYYSPPFSRLLEMDHDEINRRIRAARPDLLFVSFGCPKQEKWISMHYRSLGVPVAAGVGGTIDFLAGRLARAPRWMQRTGTEWIFRMLQEPRRLVKRYAKDLVAFGGPFLQQWWALQIRRRQNHAAGARADPPPQASLSRIHLPEWFDMEAVQRLGAAWEAALRPEEDCCLDLQAVQFIDSTGVGWLIRLHKRARLNGRSLILVAPSKAVRRALEAMRLDDFFEVAADAQEAQRLARGRGRVPAALIQGDGPGESGILVWQGEVTAANAAEVWPATERFIAGARGAAELTLDLSRVRFMDSTGVGLMVRAKKAALQRQVPLRFAGVQDAVRNVLSLSKLEAYLLGELVP